MFSKTEARKTRNVEVDGRVMLAIGQAEDDFDVQLVEGRAHLLPVCAADVMPALAAQLVAKYADWMASIGLTLDEFAATYRAVIRIEPTNFLGWRGRTGGRNLTGAAARDATRRRKEPRRRASARAFGLVPATSSAA